MTPEKRREAGAKGGHITQTSGKMTPEIRSKAGLAGGKKNVESGYIQKLGRTMVETGQAINALQKARAVLAANPEINRETGRRSGLKNVESGHLKKICSLGGQVQGRKNVASGHIEKMNRALASKRPTRPEMELLGLLWSDQSTSNRFRYQVRVPEVRGLRDFIIDGHTIVEVDGIGGHGAFRNRAKRDASTTEILRSAGYVVLRDADPAYLYLRILQRLEEVN